MDRRQLGFGRKERKTKGKREYMFEEIQKKEHSFSKLTLGSKTSKTMFMKY